MLHVEGPLLFHEESQEIERNKILLTAQFNEDDDNYNSQYDQKYFAAFRNLPVSNSEEIEIGRQRLRVINNSNKKYGEDT